MEWTTNDRISQYFNYNGLVERNIELERLKTSYEKACHSEHFSRVVKELLDLNETLKRKLVINESNIKNVIQQDLFLQIPTNHMTKILSDLDDMRSAKRKTLDLLLRQANFFRERYHNLLMKIFACRIQVDTHDPRATVENCQLRKAALNLNRCESAIRNARNIHGYYARIGNFLFKDNLDNNRSLVALQQAIQEQMMLMRKTTTIGRSVLNNVAKLNIDIKKLTKGFNTNRERTLKSLMYHKAILSKERSAIVDASMKEVDKKRWSSRYDAMTKSMDDLQTEKENVHTTILAMKHASLNICEANILSDMERKTKQIMQAEKQIYEKEIQYKQLDETIQEAKYLLQGDGHHVPSSTKNIKLGLEEERHMQIKLKASLDRLNSFQMLLDDFFTYIPQVIERHCIKTPRVDMQQEEYQNFITLSALLGLFKPDGLIKNVEKLLG